MVNESRDKAPAGTSFGDPSKGVCLYLAPVHTHFAKPATCTRSRLGWEGWGGGGAVLFCCDVYTRLLIMFSDWENLTLYSSKPFTYQRGIISKVIFIRILLSVIVLFSTVGTGQWFLPALRMGRGGLSLAIYLSIYIYIYIPSRFSSMCSNFEKYHIKGYSDYYYYYYCCCCRCYYYHRIHVPNAQGMQASRTAFGYCW